MGPANLNNPTCINVNFNKPQGKMKIAVVCLVALLAVVIKAAPVQEEQEGDVPQEMNIEAREADAFEQLRQEMNIEARAEAEVFERLLNKLDTMAKREPIHHAHHNYNHGGK